MAVCRCLLAGRLSLVVSRHQSRAESVDHHAQLVQQYRVEEASTAEVGVEPFSKGPRDPEL